MLEANPDISAHNVTLYPQLIIEDRGVSLYGDFDHIESFGCERFWRVFTKHLRKAVNDFTCGKKGRLFYKKIRGIEALRAQYRFPPRVFAPCHVSEIDSDTSFRLHYAEPSRWQQALSRLRNLDLSARLERFEKHAGSELPVFHLSCQPLQICRSLVKFAINSLAATFQQTEFNNRRFREAISFVMGDSTIFTDIRSIQRILASNGFVEPSTLADISRIDSHVVRLVHDSSEQMWHGYFSFFGGQVCAVATFPGPNFEDWSSVELCFKVASKSHSVKTYRLTLPPTTTKVTWQQVPKMLPTLPLRNIHTQLSYTEN